MTFVKVNVRGGTESLSLKNHILGVHNEVCNLVTGFRKQDRTCPTPVRVLMNFKSDIVH